MITPEDFRGYWSRPASGGWIFRTPGDDPMTPLFDAVWTSVHGGESMVERTTAIPAVGPRHAQVGGGDAAWGIDTASWQGQPDWNRAAGAGLSFVYVKSSEGSSTSYSTLDQQYQGARAAGLAVGLYHYARPNESPEINADALAFQVNRLAAVGGHLPPCLDLEEGSGDLSGWTRRFVARLRAQTGCTRVMVYSGASFFQTNIGEGWMDDDIAVWIAHYGVTPGRPRYLTPRVAIHQYSSTGQVPGIAGNVDMNQAIWPLERIVGDEEDVNLSVTQLLPPGQGMEVPVIVPPFEADQAVLRMCTGWDDATIYALYFVRDRGPGLSPEQEQWGGALPFVLVHDDRPWFPLPSGTTQISVQYDASHPIQVMVTYKPAAELW